MTGDKGRNASRNTAPPKLRAARQNLFGSSFRLTLNRENRDKVLRRNVNGGGMGASETRRTVLPSVSGDSGGELPEGNCRKGTAGSVPRMTIVLGFGQFFL